MELARIVVSASLRVNYEFGYLSIGKHLRSHHGLFVVNAGQLSLLALLQKLSQSVGCEGGICQLPFAQFGNLPVVDYQAIVRVLEFFGSV